MVPLFPWFPLFPWSPCFHGSLVLLVPPVPMVPLFTWLLPQVGQQTVGHSKDEILKKDLPLTLDMVESSSKMLVESATGLKADSQSKKHLELLLNGARG